jgi:hypothetical protein
MTDEAWWRGRQWTVDADGIYCPEHDYFIKADRLGETRPGRPGNPHDGWPDWPMHLAEKPWVDIDDFLAAFAVALALHGRRFKREFIRGAFDWARREHKSGAEIDRHCRDIEREMKMTPHEPVNAAVLDQIVKEARRRRDNKIDPSGGIDHRGVYLESQGNVAEEYETMKAAVNHILDHSEAGWLLGSVYCESRAGACYDITCSPSEWGHTSCSEEDINAVADAIDLALRTVQGGHGGICITSGRDEKRRVYRDPWCAG